MMGRCTTRQTVSLLLSFCRGDKSLDACLFLLSVCCFSVFSDFAAEKYCSDETAIFKEDESDRDVQGRLMKSTAIEHAASC